jgi:hypothetical protein
MCQTIEYNSAIQSKTNIPAVRLLTSCPTIFQNITKEIGIAKIIIFFTNHTFAFVELKSLLINWWLIYPRIVSIIIRKVNQ